MNVNLDFKDPAWAQQTVEVIRQISVDYQQELASCIKEGTLPYGSFRELGKQNLIGVLCPEEYGGYGGHAPEYCLVTETIARYGLPSTQAQIQGMVWLLFWGTEAQKRRYLPGMCDGSIVFSESISEPGAGSSLKNMKTTARRDGDDWILNGQKTHINGGAACHVTVVFAMTDEGMNPHGIAALQHELDALSGANGAKHYLCTLNIMDRDGVRAFRDAVLERYAQVDTVLSNVGIGFFGPFEETDLDAARRCLEINVIGAASIFQAFLPSMRQRRCGKLIAMSSLVGQVPFPFESIYSASKFAIEGMVLSLRYEVEPFGVQVALIEPAQVSTNFASKIHQLPPPGSPYRERAQRFIARDDELIKTAPTPQQAGRRIATVVRQPKPALHNQIDFMSSFFLVLNRFLPRWMRDAILLRHMDIR